MWYHVLPGSLSVVDQLTTRVDCPEVTETGSWGNCEEAKNGWKESEDLVG